MTIKNSVKIGVQSITPYPFLVIDSLQSSPISADCRQHINIEEYKVKYFLVQFLIKRMRKQILADHKVISKEREDLMKIVRRYKKETVIGDYSLLEGIFLLITFDFAAPL